MINFLKEPQTTGIGSLPHHNVDAALEYSFKHTLPFLPQIPTRNPREFMVAQALDCNTPISSCWHPWLRELEERKTPVAKVQLAGPLTCQWVLQGQDGTTPDLYPELDTQIFRLVLAKSIAMVRRLKSLGTQPVFYIDEPCLDAFSSQNPKYELALQELKIMVQTLQKEGATVGLHCCGLKDDSSDPRGHDSQYNPGNNTALWEKVLGLGIDLLSIDTALSLESVLKSENGQTLKNFVEKGGRISFGIIPTEESSALHTLDSKNITQQLFRLFHQHWSQHWPNGPHVKDEAELIQKVIHESILTPACGLALKSPSNAELIFEKLVEVYDHVRST
jgi:hypothetical protein